MLHQDFSYVAGTFAVQKGVPSVFHHRPLGGSLRLAVGRAGLSLKRAFCKAVSCVVLQFGRIVALFGLAALAGCGTTPPSDFPEKWDSLNTFTEEIQVIPLSRPYVYQAIKLDVTLLGMLTRWTEDSGLKLQSECKNDFSISGRARGLAAASIEEAAKEVESIYAAHHVRFKVSGPQTVVLTCAEDSPSTSAGPVESGAEGPPATIKVDSAPFESGEARQAARKLENGAPGLSHGAKQAIQPPK
jgi:hypothetical protein